MVKSEPKSQHNDIILYSKCWIEQKEITILSWFIVNFFLWKKIIFPKIQWIINLSFCELFIDHFNQRWSTHDFFLFHSKLQFEAQFIDSKLIVPFSRSDFIGFASEKLTDDLSKRTDFWLFFFLKKQNNIHYCLINNSFEFLT